MKKELLNHLVIGLKQWRSKSITIFMFFYIFLIGITLNNTYAQGWFEDGTTPYLSPEFNVEGMGFGGAVDVDGRYAVVGAKGRDGEKGAAFVYWYDGESWVKQAELTASYGDAGDWFGYSVSISGDQIVVGAPRESNPYWTFSGAVYVFEKPAEGWRDMNQTAILTDSYGGHWDEFGTSVSIFGDQIVVGAPFDRFYDIELGSVMGGAAFVFEKGDGGWRDIIARTKLVPSERNEDERFGISVDIWEGQVVVGASYDDNYAGAAYVFERPLDGWKETRQTAKLIASDRGNSDFFGKSVSISENQIVVGAEGHENNDGVSGAAFVFEKPSNGWQDMQPTAKMDVLDPEYDRGLGRSVSISNNNLVIGAYNMAYFFEKDFDGWQDMTQTFKLSPSDDNSDSFGNSVSISGNQVVVGGPWTDDKDNGSGSVYFMNKDDAVGPLLSEEQKIIAPDFYANTWNETGSALAIDGVYAVVGVPGYDDSRGRVMVLWYDGDHWLKQAELSASDGEDGNNFGSSVDISGDQIVVGAYNDHPEERSRSGSAYVFEKPAEGWQDMSQTAKLSPAFQFNDEDDFGYSVSISGDQVVVGAPFHYDDNDRGYVYVFEKPAGGWQDMNQTATLRTEGGTSKDWFGAAVDISGNLIAVGAPEDRVGEELSGSVYLFQKENDRWQNMTETARLFSSDGDFLNYFGTSVSISGDQIVVGAYGSISNKFSPGKAYVFVKGVDGWQDMSETGILSASDGHTNNYFGKSVNISGERVLVGAPKDSNGSIYSGSAYIFEKGENGWMDMTENYKITPKNGRHRDYFGTSVGIYEGGILVGSPYKDEEGTNSGAVYSFKFCSNGLEKPQNQSLEVDANCKAILPDYSGLISLPEGVSPESTIVQNPEVGSIVTSNTKVSLTLLEGSGDCATVSFEVALLDKMAPELSQPSDQTLVKDDKCEAILPDYRSLVSISDNCDPFPSLEQSPEAGTVVFESTQVTLQATDDSENSYSVSFEVELLDNHPPDLSQPLDQVLIKDENCQAVLPDFSSLITITDNCDNNPQLVQEPEAGELITETTNVKLMVTDISNNSSSVSFSVHLVDESAPAINQLSNVELPTDESCEVILPDFSANFVVSDNCDSDPLVVQTPEPGTVITTPTTIFMKVSDVSNNNTEWTFEVIPNDNREPVPNLENLAIINGACAVFVPTAPTATDNCGEEIIGKTDLSIFPIEKVGTTEIVWKFEDGNGNSTTQTQQVIISPLDNSITQNEEGLMATANGYTYQWLDCANGNAPISGKTDQTFFPKESGSYAVEISDGICSVISKCREYVILGVNESNGYSRIKTYPNPTNELLYIEKESSAPINIRLIDSWGRERVQLTSHEKITLLNLTSYSAGIYYLIIFRNGENQLVQKILKQ
ncbi:T9SS type A sorting domain-containing protein [Xanthovirga aplysinae]|uniref:T9SS type A sorting domain-containing protein n=1 Tax=Xanthovirga aplysinae TaxID=2529853 RepID=UPI0012BD6203|nr:T9SS type A sorting domain-containing protein [Xanthovirga aplysinae]MTI31637.1 T9SS type A sorting domain-containing protein [Xanthovirga aplysinae]